MRILGPDGKPIQSGPPVSDEVKEIVENARAVALQGDPAAALQQMVLAFQHDLQSDYVLGAVCDFLQMLARNQNDPQSDELVLFQKLRQDPDDPAVAYEIGSRFSQLQQPFVARPFLARASALLGETRNDLAQAVGVDLARVLMDLGIYDEAIEGFHTLNDAYGGLPVWLVLEMAECYALLGQLTEAEAVYEIAPEEAADPIPGMLEVREEVRDLIARVEDFENPEEMGLREWHYVQTRGILLETNPDEETPGERFVVFQPTEEEIAWVIGVAAAFLDARGYAPDRLLWLGSSSETLARLFAQWWEIDDVNIRAYQLGDNPETDDGLSLLVMAHSYDIAELQDEATFIDLAQARPGLIVFALDLHWTDRQPMTPDIAGFMSQICNLPWEDRLVFDEETQTATPVQETRSPQSAAEEISAFFPEEEECDRLAQELAEVYNSCTDLILDHRDGTLIRRPLVTHSPVKSPRFGF